MQSLMKVSRMLFKLSCPHLLSTAADAAAAAAAADADADAAAFSRNHSIPKTSFGGIQLRSSFIYIPNTFAHSNFRHIGGGTYK